MTEFVPRAGAAGYQLSNPSALDTAALVSTLEIFNETSMSALRARSLRLTGYLEYLLLHTPVPTEQSNSSSERPFSIITPSDPQQRGAQLSIKLNGGEDLLNKVLAALEDQGVVTDERKPNVIRVAPTPLYNTFVEVWDFVQIFLEAAYGNVHQM